jgi:hypothetical protein
MALSTYTDLQASVANWLHRTDLTAVIPDLVVLAEARIARDLRLRSQVVSATLSTVANQRTVTFPTDWLEFENVTLVGDPDSTLTYVNIQYLDTRFPNNYATGKPVVCSIEGQNLLLGPTPDAVYSISTLYYQRWPALATAATNWLLTNHPSLYLFATLAEAAPFLQDDARAALWEGKYAADVNRLQISDDAGQFSGSGLRVRAL